MVSRADQMEMLFFIAVGMALAAAVGFGLYVVLAAAGRRREPGCGQCGYPVKGLSTFLCPECGGDLREVGIERFRRSNRTWVIAATVGLAVGAAVTVAGGWLSL